MAQPESWIVSKPGASFMGGGVVSGEEFVVCPLEDGWIGQGDCDFESEAEAIEHARNLNHGAEVKVFERDIAVSESRHSVR